MKELKKSIPLDWESQLERIIMLNMCIRSRDKAYIASPCRAETLEELRLNMKAARFYLYYVHKNFSLNALAPHAYLPIMLNDSIPAERESALDFCLARLNHCQLFLMCGNRMTDGMRGEAAYAAQRAIPMKAFSAEIYKAAHGLLKREGFNTDLLIYDEEHPLLAMSAEEMFCQEVQYA